MGFSLLTRKVLTVYSTCSLKNAVSCCAADTHDSVINWGLREAYLQCCPVKLGLQNILHWHPWVDLSKFIQSQDTFICPQFHLRTGQDVVRSGRHQCGAVCKHSYLFISEGELALSALQSSVVHPHLCQVVRYWSACFRCPLPWFFWLGFFTKVICGWWWLVSAITKTVKEIEKSAVAINVTSVMLRLVVCMLSHCTCIDNLTIISC